MWCYLTYRLPPMMTHTMIRRFYSVFSTVFLMCLSCCLLLVSGCCCLFLMRKMFYC